MASVGLALRPAIVSVCLTGSYPLWGEGRGTRYCLVPACSTVFFSNMARTDVLDNLRHGSQLDLDVLYSIAFWGSRQSSVNILMKIVDNNNIISINFMIANYFLFEVGQFPNFFLSKAPI